jgi:hypothetical protein
MPELTVHLNRPSTMNVRLIRACPTCKQRRRFAGFDSPPWYGVTLTCCACGDTWSDGERQERPFMRGWRKKSIAEAKATWAMAVRYGSPEHRAFVRAQFADSLPARELET